MRPSKRLADEMREISFVPEFTKYAEGSVLAAFGHTKVLCTASVSKGVPRWLRDAKNKQGWITAEYSMLPRATHTRKDREATRGKQTGRTLEIQRLIGRSLRAAVDLTKLGEYTITVDCDVIQADAGTRTAAVSGACVALVLALQDMQRKRLIKQDPLRCLVAAVSVGIVKGEAVLDLDYDEDCGADTDMNVVSTESGDLIEVQGTAEGAPFSPAQLTEMMVLAQIGIQAILEKQRELL